MSFNDFIHKYKLKNEATSIIKIVLSSLSLSDVGIYLRDSPFESELGIVKLHPSRGTHWVVYINHYYFDSYGSPPFKKLSNFIKSKHRKCIYFEYRVQENDSVCASYVLYVIYST